MQIIISPAKKMKVDRDSFPVLSKASFLDEARMLERFLKSRTPE